MLDRVDPEAGSRLFRGNLDKHPDHDWTHRALAYEAMEAEDAAAALRHYDAFAGEDLDRNYELYPMLLMLQRVVDGAPYSPGVAERLDRAGRMGETGYEVARRRLVHRAAARDGSLDEIIADYEAEWVAAGGQPMEAMDRAWVTAQAGAAGGFQAEAAGAMEALADNADLARSLSEFGLMLALSDGGDRGAVPAALAGLPADDTSSVDFATVAAAAALQVDADDAAVRIEALEATGGPRDPARVLRAGLDLTDAAAVRAAVDEVEAPLRGTAWAAVAVVLDGRGQADHPVARTARQQARVWGYPGNQPHWED
jgi:hypothetical protein